MPVEQIERVSRYAGGDHPQLSKLGGGEWQRARSRVRKAVGDLARDLLRLYADRAKAHGRSFGEDTPWQSEMEAAFPYEETPDQLRAAIEVKADLERDTPMDRLVVGDVGYGKTEVALRAAFKAIQAGTQVAVLVPTTVLAAQHLLTFSQRFAAYPMTVRSLSRFVSKREQQDTLAGLEAGTVDVVIGTHRLLSQDIHFKDLGLVVVDEEQRFGVTHKERLKQLKTEVHVLTLSATPIPRTLNLALVGVRDMSVIETPPEDRLPIQTRVAEASAGLVRDAILRELDRGGQVFYVHNRVETIDAQAEQLRRLLPSARIVVAHGQMPEGALEKVMLAFAAGEYDVLVCTTIIESGLDIPNANTIIIDRADALGLAQLYQLRGRVGRSSRRAYAYLLYRRKAALSDVARKRLAAIFNASELGAGFQIALSDLEIRGAGNILGAEQHGHMAAVGFDLYTRMLAEAVEEEKAAAGRSRGSHRAHAGQDRPASRCLPARRVRARGAAEAGAVPAPGPRRQRRRARARSRLSCSTAMAPCRRRSSACWTCRGCATAPRRPACCRSRARMVSWCCASGPTGHVPTPCARWRHRRWMIHCERCRGTSATPRTRCACALPADGERRLAPDAGDGGAPGAGGATDEVVTRALVRIGRTCIRCTISSCQAHRSPFSCIERKGATVLLSSRKESADPGVDSSRCRARCKAPARCRRSGACSA